MLLRTFGQVFGVFSTGSLEKASSMFMSLVSKSVINVVCIILIRINNVHLIITFIIGVGLLGFLTFVIANIFFMVLDLTGRPEALLQYKIQEDKGVPVSFTFAISLITNHNCIVIFYYR